MKKLFVTLYVILNIFIMCAHASPYIYNDDLDTNLRIKLKQFDITPLVSIIPTVKRSSYLLGKKLFSDKELSGNHNISCITCHDPNKGTSDGLLLSQTFDGKNILRRNSPSLFNTGHTGREFMFWDGRVHYVSEHKVFFTPEEALNGLIPKARNITNVLTSALSAQALFPLVSFDEMRGNPGDNEIANASDNLEAWSLIVDRVLKKAAYRPLLAKAYPILETKQINIGHLAEAIAAFEKVEFESINTPFNRYLNGDNRALNIQQKRGLNVFLTSGKCIACHRGGALGGEEAVFMNVGVPSFGKVDFNVDHGRREVKGQEMNGDFEFKTPSLVNVALTGPYMHNGAFETIRDVINHYGNSWASLMEFDLSFERVSKLPVPIRVEKNPAILRDIFLSVPPVISQNIIIGEDEKNDLEAFLTQGLTDPRFIKH